VWIAAHLPVDRAAWLAAARLVMPVEAVLCGVSAVDSYGVDVRNLDDVTVHAAFEGQVPRQRKGCICAILRCGPTKSPSAAAGW
jgi:hypothetical protein